MKFPGEWNEQVLVQNILSVCLQNVAVKCIPGLRVTHVKEGILTPILSKRSLSSGRSWSGCREISPRLAPPSLKS